jgi:glycosyltransferase involved in cell wall biosynthesis
MSRPHSAHQGKTERKEDEADAAMSDHPGNQLSRTQLPAAEDIALAEPPPISGLSVVIPAYNEEHGIRPVLDQLSTLLASSPWPYEIIVVDDGSQDGTRAIVQDHTARDHGDVRLVVHPVNQGYGAALKTGILRSSYDLVCITDADGTYPNERIPELVEHCHANSCDMVVGARTSQHVVIPLARRPAKWMIGQLASFVSGQPIPDINSGLRVMRRSSVLPFWNLLPSGFSFTTTITLCMLTSHYLVAYVPVNYHARIGASKIKPIRDTLNFVKLILTIALYFAPLKIFLPLSGMLCVLALVWGIFTHVVLGRLADVSTMVIFMTSIQIAMLGLLAELINRRLPNIHRREEHPYREEA